MNMFDPKRQSKVQTERSGNGNIQVKTGFEAFM